MRKNDGKCHNNYHYPTSMEWNKEDLCPICKTPTVFGTELVNCSCIVCQLPLYGVAY